MENNIAGLGISLGGLENTEDYMNSKQANDAELVESDNKAIRKVMRRSSVISDKKKDKREILKKFSVQGLDQSSTNILDDTDYISGGGDFDDSFDSLDNSNKEKDKDAKDKKANASENIESADDINIDIDVDNDSTNENVESTSENYDNIEIDEDDSEESEDDSFDDTLDNLLDNLDDNDEESMEIPYNKNEWGEDSSGSDEDSEDDSYEDYDTDGDSDEDDSEDYGDIDIDELLNNTDDDNEDSNIFEDEQSILDELARANEHQAMVELKNAESSLDNSSENTESTENSENSEDTDDSNDYDLDELIDNIQDTEDEEDSLDAKLDSLLEDDSEGYEDDNSGYEDDSSDYGGDSEGYEDDNSGYEDDSSDYGGDSEGYEDATEDIDSLMNNALDLDDDDSEGYEDDDSGYEDDSEGYEEDSNGYEDDSKGNDTEDIDSLINNALDSDDDSEGYDDDSEEDEIADTDINNENDSFAMALFDDTPIEVSDSDEDESDSEEDEEEEDINTSDSEEESKDTDSLDDINNDLSDGDTSFFNTDTEQSKNTAYKFPRKRRIARHSDAKQDEIHKDAKPNEDEIANDIENEFSDLALGSSDIQVHDEDESSNYTSISSNDKLVYSDDKTKDSLGTSDKVNKPVEDIKPSKPKLTREEKIAKYSVMTNEELYSYVKKYMQSHGVSKKLIDISELNHIFGESNIRKLINKSYIIRLGKGVTIGR